MSEVKKENIIETKSETTTETKAKSTAEIKPELTKTKVEVEKTKLDEILNLVKEQGKVISEQAKKIENIEKNGIEQKPLIIKKVKDHYVMLRKFKNEIVKGFDSDVYKEWDEKSRDWKLYVDIKLYNDEVVKKVDYLDFISNAPRVKAKIIKTEKNDVSNVEAYINTKEPQGEFGTIITDVVVPVESIVTEYDYKVEVEGIGELELNEKVINI